MPKTKFQNFIFTLMVSLLMAYLMIVYNIAINSSAGLVNNVFILAFKEFPIEALIVFILAYFIASPIARKLAFGMVNVDKDNNMFIILTIQTLTVCIMVSLMSIYAIIINNLVNSNFLCNWIVLVCKNFIMAYPLQILIVGPFVRKIFKLFIKNN